ncbi:glycoside hydrolase family 55 protein [Aplosporella prunicola CBS 121167]|uniref:Glycoside hydrolase family 55 protein n=1 Tax=Aplosporella prunicola CBS 121167 TaxID=1176127 RepID=A0A6A6BA86_9PEZI|nr:glycoside hydrolase family 55 protein [Aplosporella prunicola CBS 121167]KAF2140154.1 glycoside hydrolase family 55 protein [Aplosporella prunicola CBS 121167]
MRLLQFLPVALLVPLTAAANRYYPADVLDNAEGVRVMLREGLTTKLPSLQSAKQPIQLDQAVETSQEASACPALAPDSPSTYWLGSVPHGGTSSYLNATYGTYKVFRNVVTDFGADNTGSRDASGSIQKAINAGASNYRSREKRAYGTTLQPAVIYLPAGTYLLQGPLQFYTGTVLIGDPINPPILKAHSNYSRDYLVFGKDPNFGGTVSFYMTLKNVILDSTNLAPDYQITLLDWTVSQATQLTNVRFNMPNFSKGHTGMKAGEWPRDAGYNSNIIINDVAFYGGNVGMNVSGQQWIFKGISFNSCRIGAMVNGTDVVFSNSYFLYNEVGIEASGTPGSVVVLDTATKNIGRLLSSRLSYHPNSVVLENVANAGLTVVMAGKTLLTGSVADTWYLGNAYLSGDPTHHWTPEGTNTTTARTAALLQNGKYVSMPPPTYKEYSASKVINIKAVPNLVVMGDGVTDDTANINAILARYAGCAIIYWPAGTYIATDTIIIPMGTRIFGDAYSAIISAYGTNFADASRPRALVKVGNAGDKGVAQISNMMFTVADILPGCKLLEVNMAGINPGDVGIWNTHFRVGGAVGSRVRSECLNVAAACKAAWGLLHLTSTSSAYIENMWGWTADHDLDSGIGADAPAWGYNQTVSVGRGALIEATQGTWLIGTAMEHATLYQYRFHGAANVVSTLAQAETAYWQGPGNAVAPEPWAQDLVPSDPGFANCAPGDALCGMAWFMAVGGGSHDLFLYGGCLWVFFNNKRNVNAGTRCDTLNGDCQENAVLLEEDTQRTWLYGLNVKSVTFMVRSLVNSGSVAVAEMRNNTGGWSGGMNVGGVVAAYLFDT